VAWEWYDEVVVARNKSPRTIQRVIEKDLVPAIGDKAVDAVTVLNAQAITDAIKKRGSDQMALVTRNIGARLFRYAIARQLCTFNPFAALDAAFIAQARSRDVALTLDEVGRLLRAVYQSSMRRSHKLAVHLLVLTLARKGEVIAATWQEISFEEKLWSVPNTRMKMGKPHLVPLAPEALALLEELRHLAGDSPFVVPSSHSLDKPIAASTLNTALRGNGQVKAPIGFLKVHGVADARSFEPLPVLEIVVGKLLEGNLSAKRLPISRHMNTLLIRIEATCCHFCALFGGG
jgi:integrase